jgi:hypothetical protein
VIVWVNGAFGVGKSHTAAELVRRVPGAVLSDPEPVGFSLHRMQPKPLRTDFQDIAGWRVAIREVIATIDADGRWPVVVVPMTIVDEAHFADTVGWLRDHGHDVRHVALVATADTIRRTDGLALDAVVEEVARVVAPLPRVRRHAGCATSCVRLSTAYPWMTTAYP